MRLQEWLFPAQLLPKFASIFRCEATYVVYCNLGRKTQDGTYTFGSLRKVACPLPSFRLALKRKGHGRTGPGGRAFEHKVGVANGDELVTKYVQVLAATRVTGYPIVNAAPPSGPSLSGTGAYALGVRVSQQELIDMNAYVFGLQAPAGVNKDPAAASRGQHLFRTVGCTSCHNVDQTVFVPTNVIPMKADISRTIPPSWRSESLR